MHQPSAYPRPPSTTPSQPQYGQPYIGVSSSPYGPPRASPLQVLLLGPEPTYVRCPNCGNTILTTTTKELNLLGFVAGFIIAMMGCFCGCCLIPCCIDVFKNVKHTCPICRTYLGEYRH